MKLLVISHTPHHRAGEPPGRLGADRARDRSSGGALRRDRSRRAGPRGDGAGERIAVSGRQRPCRRRASGGGESLRQKIDVLRVAAAVRRHDLERASRVATSPTCAVRRTSGSLPCCFSSFGARPVLAVDQVRRELATERAGKLVLPPPAVDPRSPPDSFPGHRQRAMAESAAARAFLPQPGPHGRGVSRGRRGRRAEEPERAAAPPVRGTRGRRQGMRAGHRDPRRLEGPGRAGDARDRWRWSRSRPLRVAGRRGRAGRRGPFLRLASAAGPGRLLCQGALSAASVEQQRGLAEGPERGDGVRCGSRDQ